MPDQGMKKAGGSTRRSWMAHAGRAWLPLAYRHDVHGEQAANEGTNAQAKTHCEVCGAADKNGAVLNRGRETAHLGHRLRDSGVTGVGGEVVGGDFEGLFYRGGVLSKSAGRGNANTLRFKSLNGLDQFNHRAAFFAAEINAVEDFADDMEAEAADATFNRGRSDELLKVLVGDACAVMLNEDANGVRARLHAAGGGTFGAGGAVGVFADVAHHFVTAENEEAGEFIVQAMVGGPCLDELTHEAQRVGMAGESDFLRCWWRVICNRQDGGVILIAGVVGESVPLLDEVI